MLLFFLSKIEVICRDIRHKVTRMNAAAELFAIDSKVDMTIHVEIDHSNRGKILSYIINRTPDHLYKVVRVFTRKKILGPDDLNDETMEITDRMESIMTLKAVRSLIIQNMISIGWNDAIKDIKLWLGWKGGKKDPNTISGMCLANYRYCRIRELSFGGVQTQDENKLVKTAEHSVKRIFDIIDGIDMLNWVEGQKSCHEATSTDSAVDDLHNFGIRFRDEN